MRKHTQRAVVFGMLLLAAALALPRATTVYASAQIRDDANVLTAPDRNDITAAAQRAPFNVTVWTTSAYSDKNAFYDAVRGAVGDNSVVLGVDPVHKWSHISAKQNTGLTADDVTAADAQANASFGSGQWGAGFVNAINTLSTAAPVGGTNPGTTNPLPATSPSGGFSLGGLWLCLIPLILVVLAGFFLRNRFGSRAPVAPTYPAQYPNQGYPPAGYPNQGYAPGAYPPGGYYNQPGSNLGGNLAAGGLGALAGGAIGYELGRHQGDAQGNPAPQYTPDFGGGGIVDSAPGGPGADFGGGGVDFGGGGGGVDFGGGGTDSGGSSDFGGAGSGDVV